MMEATPVPLTPTEAECLKEGNDYYNGSNGRERDYEKHAEWMQRGHELGYLNCTAQLCDCYAGGYGVPRDFDRAMELAQEMERKNFPLGWKYMAAAYAEGHGVPLDKKKALSYARRLQQALARPVAGVEDNLRFSALLSVYVVLNSVDNGACTEEYVRIARECLLESDLPERYAYYASALLYRTQHDDGADMEASLQEAMSYLEKGVALGNGMAMYLLSVLLQSMGDPEGRVPQLLPECARMGQAAAVGEILSLGMLRDEQTTQFDNIYWALCNLGASCKRRENRLPCQMRLLHSPFTCDWRVHAEPGQEVSPLSSSLLIVNEGQEALSGLTLRLCSADAGVDFRLGVPECLEPESGIEVSLSLLEEEAGKAVGKEFYLELSDGTRRAEMTLDHSLGLEYFHKKVDMSALPYELWWERGLFGSLVLCVRCTKGELHDLTVACRRGRAVSDGHTLREGEVKRFGRMEFRSFRGLAPGEEMGVYCEEFPTARVQLCE